MAKTPQENQTAEAENTEAEADKPSRKVADHAWLGPDGKEVDKITEATGYSYLSLKPEFTFDFQTGSEAGSPVTMCALFGAKTLAINTASGARQQGEDQEAEIKDRFEKLAEGVWRESKGGGKRGPKYDREILAKAIVAVAGDKAQGDAAHYQKRLEEEKGFVNKVVHKTAIMAKYYELAETNESEDVDSIL